SYRLPPAVFPPKVYDPACGMVSPTREKLPPWGDAFGHDPGASERRLWVPVPGSPRPAGALTRRLTMAVAHRRAVAVAVRADQRRLQRAHSSVGGLGPTLRQQAP